MKRFIECCIRVGIRTVFFFRYRVKFKGLENLTKENLPGDGGILFLPNHPSVFIDPLGVSLGILQKFSFRAMIVEYIYYQPIVYTVMSYLDALPVPDFDIASNSLKKKRSEEVVQTVIQDLAKGQNFLIYPAGRTKSTGIEALGGASAVHRIVQEVPGANVVLVRTKGLWGSSFSRAFTGKSPPLFPTIFANLKHVLKNLIFFSPRRYIEIEFVPAPADFPWKAEKSDFNKWLERWYNAPDGLTKQEGEFPGDSLILRPYSMWSKELPVIKPREEEAEAFNVEELTPAVKEKVMDEIALITKKDKARLNPQMFLDSDLGLDSLEMAELAAYVQHQFDIKKINVFDMTTIARVMAIADKKYICEEESEAPVKINLDKWFKSQPKKRIDMPAGETIAEVFLRNCDRFKNQVACADDRSGILTYQTLKLRVIMLAQQIQKLPGDYIGVLLPSTVAAYATVLAIHLAGKVPLMINWTAGTRHLEAVEKMTKVKVVLSSWSFLDRLENVDLNGIEHCLVMLEDVKRDFTLGDKLKGLWRSKLSADRLMKIFGIDKKTKEDRAVLLFTSGTESLPKGVPLTHHNILVNQRSVFERIELSTDDIFMGILPPFHGFGFTVTGLLSLLSGLRIVYSPDPLDGKKLAAICAKWGITIIVGTPTFVKNIIKGGTKEDFKNIRLCVTGAEKAPPELMALLDQYGLSDQYLEGYGITECSPVLTMNRPGRKCVGVGQAANGVKLKVVHPDTFAPIPDGEVGHVLAQGENIFSGYLNPDVASPFINIDGEEWYKTGDLGRLDEEGHLILAGRQKRFIKIGGEMISLGSIEDALLQAAPAKGWEVSQEGPTLAICAKEKDGERPTILLVSKFTTTVDEVNASLKSAGFSNLVKVTAVQQLENIPLMGTGKVHYRELENRFMNA